MNINFDKSDRLITIIENAVNLLSGAPYIVKYSSDVTDYPRQLCKAYWEMQDEIIFRADDKSKDNPDDWMRFLEETKFNERYLDILAKVIVRHEPTVKDIEKEFWANCTDVHSIDKFVNIYREHWKGHLHEMDENAFDCLGMKKESESLRNIISESLQNGSILKDDALYIETTLLHLAHAVNKVTSGILNLFNRLSSPSAAGTKEDEVEADNNSPRTMKVTTDVLYEILKKAGINENTADKTVISNLISHLTEYSSEQIRQRLSNTEELTSRHKNEVDKVNGILNKLNTNISIKYNNNR